LRKTHITALQFLKIFKLFEFYYRVVDFYCQALEFCIAEHALARQSTPDHASARQSTPEQAIARQFTPERASARQCTSEYASFR
jgi:hypothetical protein